MQHHTCGTSGSIWPLSFLTIAANKLSTSASLQTNKQVVFQVGYNTVLSALTCSLALSPKTLHAQYTANMVCERFLMPMTAVLAL